MNAVSPEPSAGTLLERAYAHHAAACAVYARQIAGDAAAAEDATQEAFVRLMHHIQRQGGPPANARAWLMRATRSAAIDGARGAWRRRRRERAAPRQEVFVASQDDRLDAAAVTATLASLPERQREIVTLRKIYGLSQKEVAARLGLSEHTIESQGSIGLHKCIEYFRRHGYGRGSS